ncbi:MAG: OsmC family protein [candidate division NC10 bacterium]|nr:OsmC family protein [candidate division NC10 bacterium]
MEALVKADALCDGGDLGCGELLILLMKRMKELQPGQVLLALTTDPGAVEDLPAWCRMTENDLVATVQAEDHTRYFIRRSSQVERNLAADAAKARAYRWMARVRGMGGVQAKAFVRNHAFLVGQPASFAASDEAPSAVEYLLAGLGGCLAVGFQIRASRRGIRVEAVEVSLKGAIDNILVFLGMAEEGHPGFSRIEGSLYVKADADEAALREIWCETLARSPVANSLRQAVELDVALSIVS